MSFDAIVNNHYGSKNLMDRILEGLGVAGKDVGSLTTADLAPVDAFHTRGKAATVELATLAGITASDRVLDVGCGLGGTARHLAQEFGCRVDGLDLTEEYITVGQRLNDLVGLDDSVDLRQGSALAMPHQAGVFDVAWTEHVQMNIADKHAFYAESARVLKPGGRFLFHDVFLGGGADPIYPVPWAENAALSFLATEAEARIAIEGAGLDIESWDVRTAESAAFFEKTLAWIAENGVPPLGIHLLMGKTAPEKLRNFTRNLSEERVTVVMGSAVKKD
jgi:MPBQ/MSBQ methyltransferase